MSTAARVWDGPAPRAALENVPLYVPKPPKALLDGESHRLFLNENPYPPLPSVIAAIAEGASDINRYPEILPTKLMDAIAHHLDVPVSDVVTGPGTVGIYQQVAQAMFDPGDEIVYSWPSFEAFPIVANMAGAVAREVPLRESTQDLQAMADQVNDRTRAVFLCNPNNPTGTLNAGYELDAFIDSLPKNVLVLIDEAYAEFVPDHQGPSGLELYHRHSNVVVLRTFSKAYGLAGLRVGYGLAHESLARAFRKCAVPCGVNTLAIIAALKSLEVEQELFERVHAVIADRSRLRDALTGLGIAIPDTSTNFLWLDVGSQAADLGARLENSGILARAMPGYGIRLTVGDEHSNAHVVRVLTDMMQP